MKKEKEYEFKIQNNTIELFDLLITDLFESEEVQFGQLKKTGLLSVITQSGIDLGNLKFDHDDLSIKVDYLRLAGLETGLAGQLYYYCKLSRIDYVVQFEVLEFNHEILKIKKINS